MLTKALLFLCFLLAVALNGAVARSQELNTALMSSTFEIYGPSVQAGKTIFGTVFFMGRPLRSDPQKGSFVLITAAHVLNEISGDQAILVLRKKDEPGIFTKTPWPIQIRNGSANLYVKNPMADVAAMYLSVPTGFDIVLLSTSLLADDVRLEQLGVHPGDELLCLGFPLAIDLNGFPVIRSGILASYPITPSKALRQYYYNFHIFSGNSGGPVYFSFINRFYQGATHLGVVEQGVIGLVSQQLNSALPEFKDAPLDIAVVVPSAFIADTISMLPEDPSQ